MIKKIFAGTVLALGFASVAFAQSTVSVSWGNGDYVMGFADSSGTLLAEGSLVRLGSFASGTDFSSTSFSYLSSQFTQYGSASIGDGGFTGFPGFVTATTVAQVPFSTKLYMWTFNAASGATATEWGIFSQTAAASASIDQPYLWTTGTDPLTGGRLLDVRLADVADVGRFGAYAGSPHFSMVAMTAAVPEPATYAAVLGVLVLGVTGYRRFRRK